MWRNAKLVLGNRDLMLRILFTLLMLLLFRILVVVTIPLFDQSMMQQFVADSGFLGLLDSFSGQALQNGSIAALGISPYITGSIVVQLLQMVVPKLKEWRDQGESGKQKTSKLTRYIGIGLAAAQGFLLVWGTGSMGSVIPEIDHPNAFHYIIMTLAVTAGTALCIFIADLITKNGVGNGTSILITAGIVTGIPHTINTLYSHFITGGTGGWDVFFFILILIIYVGTLLFVTYMQIAQRKIPVQYANRQGKSDSNIPLKLNSAGVMPVIFASTIMSIPLTIIGLTGGDSSSGAGFWLNQIFSSSEPIGFVFYIILIVVFSFFYSFMTIEPNKIAENLSKSNAYIPGVRPGEDTKNYVARLLFKITVIGTIYLVIVAAIPIVIQMIWNLPSSVAIGGTSMLIVVGVAIETTQQIEADANKADYENIF